MITPERVVAPFCRLGLPDGSVATEHQGSEMVGVAFDPTGTRMYFGSQRAYPYVPGTPAADGAVYEVAGPFRLPEGGVPESWVFGPPAGEREDGAGYLTAPVPGLELAAPTRARLAPLNPTLRVGVKLARAGTVHLVLRTFDLAKDPSGDATYDRPLPVTLAKSGHALSAGGHTLALPLDASKLRHAAAGPLTAHLTAVAIDSAGKRRVAARRLTLT